MGMDETALASPGGIRAVVVNPEAGDGHGYGDGGHGYGDGGNYDGGHGYGDGGNYNGGGAQLGDRGGGIEFELLPLKEVQIVSLHN